MEDNFGRGYGSPEEEKEQEQEGEEKEKKEEEKKTEEEEKKKDNITEEEIKHVTELNKMNCRFCLLFQQIKSKNVPSHG